MTDTKVIAKCYMISGMLILISMFSHLVSLVNNYDTFLENSSHVISAFNG